MSKIFEVFSSLEAGSEVGGGASQPWNVSELNGSESQAEVLFDFLAIVGPWWPPEIVGCWGARQYFPVANFESSQRTIKS